MRDWRKLKTKQLTRAERNMRFVEKHLRVTGADGQPTPLKLEWFQEAFFYSVFDNEAITRKAIFSVSRKNGKSTLISAIVLCYLVGPEARLNAQIVSGAMSRDQASIIFKQASQIINLSPDIQPLIRIVPSTKMLIGIPRNTEYKALASDGKTTVGLDPQLILCDETGQVVGPDSDFLQALVTSQGARQDPLIIFLSTQAPTDNDYLSREIDDAETSKDPKIVCHLYAADEDCDLDDPAQWAKANPALGIFRSLSDLESSIHEAVRMPTKENSIRNYYLNQRISVYVSLVSKDVWKSNTGDPQPLKGKKVYGGLDLSAVSDLTGLVLVDEDGNIQCTTWLPEFGIVEKARNDRVPYDVWAKQGYLKLTPGKAIEYEWVAKELKIVFDEYDVQQINFDRYNMKFLRPWLVKEGFTDVQLEKFNDFGQGMVSMSPALRSLETSLLNSELKHGGHPVLTMCMANAVLEMDAAGNRKFTKKKSTGRIDLAVCLAMAEDARAAGKEVTAEPVYEIFWI